MKKAIRFLSVFLIVLMYMTTLVYGEDISQSSSDDNYSTEMFFPTENHITCGCLHFETDNADDVIYADTTVTRESVSGNDATPYLTFIDTYNNLNPQVKENVIKTFNEVYYDIFDHFNNGKYIDVTIEVITIDNNPAYTVGNKICIDYNYMNSNTEDYDVITHELVHVAQMYNAGLKPIPIWLVEGIADYGRYIYGVNNENASWNLPLPDSSSYYTDSYKISAAFLLWIENTYDANFVKELNNEIKAGTFDYSYFLTKTTYDVDTLWEKYLISNNIELPQFDITLNEPKPIPDNIDIMSYLTIENKNNCISQDLIAKIQLTFKASYANICTKFNDGNLIPVTLIFEPNYADSGSVAYTDCSTNEIVVNAKYLNENPEDYDCITHEYIHIAQNYSMVAPGWITEGIADYGRYLYGQNNDAADWRLPLYLCIIDKYDSGYQSSALFFKWLDETYSPQTSSIINKLCKEGTYTPMAWKKITGYHLLQLEEQFMARNPEHITEIKQKFPNLKLLDLNKKEVQLYDYLDNNTDNIVIYSDITSLDAFLLEQCIRYKKVVENNAKIIIILDNPTDINNIMKKMSTSDRNNFVFLIDPYFWGILWTFYDEIPNVGFTFGYPNIAYLDKTKSILFHADRGSIYGIKPETDYLAAFREFLAKRYPEKAEIITNFVYWENIDNFMPKGTVFRDGNTTYKVTSEKPTDLTLSIVTIDKNIASYTALGIVHYNNLFYKVTGIENNAIKNNKKLKEFYFSEYITTIGTNAFYGCKRLSVVEMNDNLKTISDGAFYKCTALKKIKIPKNVTKIGKNAFNGCSNLKSISLNTKLTSIGDNAFYKCTALTSIKIPKNIKKISSKTFYGCKKLKKITILSTKIKSVGKNALKGINSKCTIYVPKSKYKAYKKLFKNKGQKKSVVFKKK